MFVEHESFSSTYIFTPSNTDVKDWKVEVRKRKGGGKISVLGESNGRPKCLKLSVDGICQPIC